MTEMPDVSFIIPAYNEEKYIQHTIESIKESLEPSISCEILVIDHGSTDRTRPLAEAAGASVFTNQDAETISVLRNYGVSLSRGWLLIFIDADTALSPEWKNNFPSVYKQLSTDKYLFTGSKRVVPDDAHWISRLWFRSPAEDHCPTHLGGGHMILSRELFDKIGGFPEEYETGEDYEFCMRARNVGATIVARQSLRAIHHGVPSGIRQFFHREIWHGRGDLQRLKSLFESKVALASIVFFLLHLLLLMDVLVDSADTAVARMSALLLAVLCAASAIKQYSHQNIMVMIASIPVFYIYYWARFISFLSILWNRSIEKHER